MGFGLKPPTFLKPGDTIRIQVDGLGTLTNVVADISSSNLTPAIVQSHTTLVPTNAIRSTGTKLTTINGKQLNYVNKGVKGGLPIVFVHGLGGTLDYWTPLIMTAGLEKTHSLHLFDFEGHGLSTTSPLSVLSIGSLATDLKAVFENASISSGAVLIAHSMGCLIALDFVINNPRFVSKLVLVGPPPSPLPETPSKGSYARAAAVRAGGMSAVADTVATAGTSESTKSKNAVAFTAVKLSLLGQDPEGYAKACTALAAATATTLDVAKIKADVLIITGSEDKVGPPDLCRKYQSLMPNAREPVILPDVGHWHVFEDCAGVSKAVEDFLHN